MIDLSQANGSLWSLAEAPSRIVSLVPSITENLLAFGKEPVGRTSFCIEPKGTVESIPVVGGTKTPKLRRIFELKPDLVIANQEENRKEDVEALRRKRVPVWVTYPRTVSDVVNYMKELAQLCPDASSAESSISALRAEIEQAGKTLRRPSIVALIWKEPWMAIGADTYVHDLIEVAGGRNAAAGKEGRYPTLTEEEIKAMKPDHLLLPSEPYEFTAEHQRYWEDRWKGTGVVCRVSLFSGENLSWFGPRTVDGLRELRALVTS